MLKLSYSVIGVFLIAVLMSGSLPRNAQANDGERAMRLHTAASMEPIGSVSALGSIDINGRTVAGEQKLWGGEFIEAPAGVTTLAVFDWVGRVTLSGGAAVRLATSKDDAGGRLLIASLARGSISCELDKGASAYLEAGSSRFTALPGASFRVGFQEGRPVLNTVSGTVTGETQAGRPTYKIRPVDELGRPVDLGRTLSVRARSTRNFQIQVTDENDRPIPDLPILFSLTSPCLGSLGLGAAGGTSFRKKSDNKGIAAVPFLVGAAKCLGSLSAKVEGTSAEFTQEIQVQPRSSFWSPRNSLLVAAGVAGAVVGTVLGVTGGGNGDPIRPVPPPTVKP